MRLDSVLGNGQRLDGGAMFGNCPRAVWERWAAPDAQHRIELACRCLLIREDDGRKVLLETGIGAFFPPKLRERFGVVSDRHLLLENLAALGVAPDDIDVVVLSHLHFDHAGGLLQPFEEGRSPELAFPRAHFVTSKDAWARACAPHARDQASFIPELPELLTATGRLELADGVDSQVLGPAYRFRYSDGHTPGLMLTTVETPRGPVCFLGDLIPGTPWVHLPITMGYDRFPEQLIDEKQDLLEALRDTDGWGFFTHDPRVAMAKVRQDERGRFVTADATEDGPLWPV